MSKILMIQTCDDGFSYTNDYYFAIETEKTPADLEIEFFIIQEDLKIKYYNSLDNPKINFYDHLMFASDLLCNEFKFVYLDDWFSQQLGEGNKNV